MNEQNKIELGKFIVHDMGRINFDHIASDIFYISHADLILDKIRILGQNTPKSPDPTTKPLLCVCNNQIGGDQQDNGHICGVCYQVYCGECLEADFDICRGCMDDGKSPVSVNDKNGKGFWAGHTLRNESSLTTSVKILQINETHIVSEPGGVTEVQDFIDAGWVVHERVTRYEMNKNFECFNKCKFTRHYIGSMGCDGCNHNIENNPTQQWIICELYNKENEDGK